MDSILNLQSSSINSQVPSSLSSPSCPSEPPDVGNWFSSYQYQSPNLDSHFTLQESDFRKHESERDEQQEEDFDKVRVQDEGIVREKLVQCDGTCDKDDIHNKDPCFTKNMDHCSSCSLFSEPPDIRNWFSSYVYESSVFDTSSLLSDEEVSEGNKCEEERFDFEVVNKDEGQSENVQPKVCVEHSSFDKTMEGDGSAGLKKKLTIANTSGLEKILQPCMEDEALQHSLVSTKDMETVNQNHGNPGCNGEAHLMSLDTDTCAMRPPKLVQKNDTTKEAESKAEIQAEKPNISTSLAKSFSIGSSTCTRNKENDGFVTTRKNSCKRSNDENSWKKQEMTLLQCSTSTGAVPLACEKSNVTKRKALTEATNLQQSNDMEITGKWQCPQKRKPDRGPALKQLRLERWVRRVGNTSPQ
ncbi:hypothetical protein TSUD_226680 [Trifolium subterraneum]|uniref:Uncharacterized protein n=1 Tax=Trifolium subterraneum TaxID=3900 RepID=A0A2Z6NHY7_TRISU|nr:hypothetical protein TSUD_226680 [Trifolium subterraneum]